METTPNRPPKKAYFWTVDFQSESCLLLLTQDFYLAFPSEIEISGTSVSSVRPRGGYDGSPGLKR